MNEFIAVDEFKIDGETYVVSVEKEFSTDDVIVVIEKNNEVIKKGGCHGRTFN